MSRIKLCVDEDAAEAAVVDGLRRRGLDVPTVLEAGIGGATDQALLQFAAASERVMYSLNVGDFARLHGAYLAAGRMHSGIIVIPRQRYQVGEKLRRLSEFVDQHAAEDVQNRLFYL